MKHANYFNKLWAKDEESRERAKSAIIKAESKFSEICWQKGY